VVENKHQQLTVFGVGSELTDGEWRGVVRQLLAQRLLVVVGDYGTLALSDTSGDVLSGKRQVLLRREPPKVPRSRRSGESSSSSRAAVAVAAADLSAEAAGVFEVLRTWRGGVAREQGMPAYVIFHDATLRQIAAHRPSTLGELSGISGVGEAKLARYGEAILEVLAALAAGQG
jgi:ATP-dependent DNA helicase RecQ